MADRADWDTATRAQRHLAVAADAELRRRQEDRHHYELCGSHCFSNCDSASWNRCGGGVSFATSGNRR